MNAPVNRQTFAPTAMPRIISEDDENISLVVNVKKAALKKIMLEHGVLLAYLLDLAREP